MGKRKEESAEEILGKVKIFPDVIAELAGLAALESYGVVRMVNPSWPAGIGQLFSRDKLRKGIKVAFSEDSKVKIELYIIIKYGVNLIEVAKNLIERVKYEVERHTQLEVEKVDVYVRGIKV